MKAIYTLLICVAISALSACAGGDCSPTAIGDVDTATKPATVVGTVDRACKDAAGNDVVCP